MAHSYLASDDQNPDFVGASNPDNRLHVRFYKHPVQNNYKTEIEGRPIFDDVDMVDIHVPGDQLTAVSAIVRPDHQRRFPQQWAMFQNQQTGDQRMAGKTPLEHWPRLTPAQVAELKAMKFLSVEDIANASDSVLQSMGMRAGATPYAFRDMAQKFLKLAADDAAASKAEAVAQEVRAENTALKEQMAQMQRQMEERFAQLAAGTAAAPVVEEETVTTAEPSKRGPGRPAKD